MQAMLIIPLAEWQQLNSQVQKNTALLEQLKPAAPQSVTTQSPCITAKEFMAAVRICRSNFDKLIHGNKIKTLKKVGKYTSWRVRWNATFARLKFSFYLL